jgi:hypothetical protein
MKFRFAAVAVSAAGLMAIPAFAAHAATGQNNGTCTAPHAQEGPAGTTQGLPDGGTVWSNNTGGTSAVSGSIGIKGGHGNLVLQGTSVSPGSYIQLSGTQTESGLNGFIKADNTGEAVCIGVAGKGGAEVDAPPAPAAP